MIRINTSITLKEYLKLLLKLTYRKPVMILILTVDVIVITWIILSALKFRGVPKVTFFQYSTAMLITIVQPFVICSTIIKNYRSSSHLHESSIIEITNELVKIKGDSFYTELSWLKTYKVEELNKWFLIYQNNLSAILICKDSFRNEDIDFKEFLRNIPGLNLHLKKGN
jgi:hypothetical protein